MALFSVPASAQTAVSSLEASYESVDDASDNYTVETRAEGGGIPQSPPYDLRFNADPNGQDNLNLLGFTVVEDDYGARFLANRINLQRVDNSNVSGTRDIVFFEQANPNGDIFALAPSFVGTMEGMLLNSIINRGTDNVFTNAGNGGGGNNNNIERIDLVYTGGLRVSQQSELSQAGFLVLERDGNDDFQVAAITDQENGDPTAFGPLVFVGSGDVGGTDYSYNSTVLRAPRDEQLKPSANVPSQTVSGVFISLEDLGVGADEQIFGYALFPPDVDSSNDLLGLSDVPTTTGGAGGMDLVAGGAAFAQDGVDFVADADGDGILNSEEGFDAPTPPDFDGDGRADYQDVDTDGDGLTDLLEAGDDPEAPVDSDVDGFPDYRDTDSDNDGTLDRVEAAPTASIEPEGTDADEDGLDDAFDTFDADDPGASSNEGESNAAGSEYATPADTDGDGTPNFRDPDNALPVEFAGKPVPTVEGRAVTLTWRTLSEEHNDGFDVQHRRQNGEAAWTTANEERIPSKAEGAATSEENTYRHTVRDLERGRYAFRVRQTDVDNGESFSQTVEVIVAGKGFALERVYPNPLRSGQATRIAFAAPPTAEVRAALYNTLGQRVRVLPVERRTGGGGAVRLETEGLASGLYFVRLTAGDRITTQAVTLVR